MVEELLLDNSTNGPPNNYSDIILSKLKKPGFSEYVFKILIEFNDFLNKTESNYPSALKSR